MSFAAKAIQKVFTGDHQLDSVQQSISEAVRSSVQSIFTNGCFLHAEDGAQPYTGLVFTAAQRRTLRHPLGRSAIGFLEIYSPWTTMAARVSLFPVAFDAGVDPSKAITVTSTNAGRVLLWVF